MTVTTRCPVGVIDWPKLRDNREIPVIDFWQETKFSEDDKLQTFRDQVRSFIEK